MRSIISRSLEPLVSTLWGVFLFWSLWLALVWTLGIDREFLGLPAGGAAAAWETGAFIEDTPPPPNAELRHAVLLMADWADLVWLTLAVVNLHLTISATNGLRTARAWLGFSAGGALLAGWLTHRTGMPFGWLSFGSALGAKFAGVAVGWVLLWAALVMGAREAVVWAFPRASHMAVSARCAAVVFATWCNIEPLVLLDSACAVRAWWWRHTGDGITAAPSQWWMWLSWLAWPALVAFAMREKDVVSAAARRSCKPAVIVALLNAAALAAHGRRVFFGG